MKRWTKKAKVLVVIALALLFLCATNLSSWRNRQLISAVKCRDVNRIALLLRYGADANTTVCTEYRPTEWPTWVPPFVSKITLFKTCDRRQTLLVFAAYTPKSPVVMALLKGGAKPDAQISRGETAMEIAVEQNDMVTVQTLLNCGANVNGYFWGRTALSTAVQQEDINMAKFLLAHGANPNQPGSDFPVFVAVEKDNVALLRLLTTQGAKTTITDGKYSENVFQRAAACNSVASLRFLMEHGQNVDQRDTNGRTALMEAVEKSHVDAIRFLLAHGANPNAKNRFGETALNMIDTGYYPKNGQRIARLLRRHGALAVGRVP